MLLIKWFIKILIINIYQSIHYKFDNLILSKNSNFEINPFFFIKSKNNISISFYKQINNDDLINILRIKCLDKYFWIFYNFNQIKIRDVIISSYGYKTNYFKFNNKKILYKIGYIVKEFNFQCDLKYLKINFITTEFDNSSKISNIQLYDNDIDYNEEILNVDFMKPLIFVDLKNENINSNKFKNKFNTYNGGIINKSNNIYSNYDYNYGTNWSYTKNIQYIELDKNALSYIKNKLVKSFSFYINFDWMLNYINNNDILKTCIISLYSIFYNNNIALNLGIFLLMLKNKYIKVKFSLISSLNIYIKQIDLNKLPLNSNNLGVKFLHFSYYNSSNQKYYIGLKKDSILKNNEKTLITYHNNKISIISNFFKRNKLKHYIGKNNFKNNNNNNFSMGYINFIININEYGFFSGNTFDEIENINENYNLKIKSKNYNIIINNNKNLDRRFSLNRINEIKKCTKSNCIICSFNNKCIFCNYNYYLDKYNNCILNSNSNYFVNEKSELIKIQNIVEDKIFNTKENIKSLKNNMNDIFNLNLTNNIIYFNFQIKSSIKSNLINLKIKNTLLFKLYLNNNSSILTLFFKDLNILNELEIDMDNKDYKLNLNFSIKQINCDNLQHEIFYKNINCNDICTLNKKKYYFKPLSQWYGKCISEVDEKYYLDNNINNLLKCPDNCANCYLKNEDTSLICKKCINGYKLLNNICIFSNEIKCYNNTNLNTIFDNKNSDNIKICKEFCSLCKLNGGIICSIINLNFDSCNINNIKVIKYRENIPKFIFNNCKVVVNSKCLICNKGYFKYKNSCIKCNNNCWECSNNYHCSKCFKGYFLKNNKCTVCNSIFLNCIECNKNKCIMNNLKINNFSKIDNKNCKIYEDNKPCLKCWFGYTLINNKCECNANNFINNKQCINCNNCNKCIDNNELKCKSCNKCKNKIIFKYIQAKNDLIISYNRGIILNENPLFFHLENITNYIVIFKLNKVIIRIFENIYTTNLIINKHVIKSSLYGYFDEQRINVTNYNLKPKLKYKMKNNSKSLIKYKKYIKYKFKNINLTSYFIESTVIYSTKIIHYSEFSVLFMPLIIFLNQSSLIVLLNTNFDSNFVNFWKLIKKNNYNLIEDFKIFNNNDYIRSFNKIKKKFKNNMIIGDINIFDLNMIIIIIIITTYSLIMYILKYINNKTIINSWNSIKYLKFIALTLFQSNLIINYYKTIYYINLFFELKYWYNRIFIGLYINFNIFIIIYYYNTHHFYCSLFLNQYFNYKDYYNKLIKLFVNFKSKISRNYNIIMNIIDFFIVLVFMEFRSLFILQIIFILLLIILKLFYLIYLYLYYKKKQTKIFFEIINIIFLLNFYILIMLKNYLYGIKFLSNYILLYFIIYNIFVIFKIIFINIFIFYKKYNKTSKLGLREIQNNNSLRNLKFNRISFKFI